MAFGVIIGYRLRHTHKIHKVTSLIQAVVCLLLFILGLSIGTNKLIVGNLSYFCRQAAVISHIVSQIASGGTVGRDKQERSGR